MTGSNQTVTACRRASNGNRPAPEPEQVYGILCSCHRVPGTVRRIWSCDAPVPPALAVNRRRR